MTTRTRTSTRPATMSPAPAGGGRSANRAGSSARDSASPPPARLRALVGPRLGCTEQGCALGVEPDHVVGDAAREPLESCGAGWRATVSALSSQDGEHRPPVDLVRVRGRAGESRTSSRASLPAESGRAARDAPRSSARCVGVDASRAEGRDPAGVGLRRVRVGRGRSTRGRYRLVDDPGAGWSRRPLVSSGSGDVAVSSLVTGSVVVSEPVVASSVAVLVLPTSIGAPSSARRAKAPPSAAPIARKPAWPRTAGRPIGRDRPFRCRVGAGVGQVWSLGRRPGSLRWPPERRRQARKAQVKRDLSPQGALETHASAGLPAASMRQSPPRR